MTVAGVWLPACQALLQEHMPSRLAAALKSPAAHLVLSGNPSVMHTSG